MPEFLDINEFTMYKFDNKTNFDEVKYNIREIDKEITYLKTFFIKKMNLFVLIFSILFTFMLTLQIITLVYQTGALIK